MDSKTRGESARTPTPKTKRSSRRVGIREVAEQAGVAIASVSRVLSDHPDVSARMRQRVLAAIDELGYRPDFLAKSLRTGSTMTVGIVVSDIRNTIMAEIVHAAEARLRESGYIAMVVSSLHDSDMEKEQIDVLVHRRVDGLMIAVNDETDQESARRLEAVTAPVLLLDRDVSGLERGWSVRFDHAAGMRQAVSHLLDLGHRNIALVNGFPYVRPSRERVAALSQACPANLDVTLEVRSGAFTAEHGYRSTLELLDGPNPPTAVISGNAQILIGVLEALQHKGLSAPADVSLVTCDAVPMASFLTPRLATIRRDAAEMGRLAAELLLGAIRQQPPQCITLPTTFEPAASCGPVAAHQWNRPAPKTL